MLANRLHPHAGGLAGAVMGLSLFSAALAEPSAPLTHIAGSPFTFPLGGYKSVNLALSPDERTLFVSNSRSGSITSLAVASASDPVPGALSFLGWSQTRPEVLPGGLAMNPEGTKLYVTSGADTVNVHQVESDGLLEQIQDIPVGAYAHTRNGTVYLSPATPGFEYLTGDFVYVNDGTGPYLSDKDQNYVSSYRVLTDGRLEFIGLTPTGGRVDYGALYAPVVLRAAGGRLFVSNSQWNIYGDPSLTSNDISVFNVASDGTLESVPGSPFPLPPGEYGSGGIALDPSAQHLYAGTWWYGDIVRFDIGPDGALIDPQVFPTGMYDTVGGMEVDPTGAYLVAVMGDLQVMDLATMQLIHGSGIPLPPNSTAYGAIVFNRAGTRLFAANVHESLGTMISVFRWFGTEIIAPQLSTVRCGTPVSANFLVRDPQGRALTATWSVDREIVRIDEIPAGTGLTETALTYESTYSLGRHTLTLSISVPGGTGPEASASVPVGVFDDVVPTISNTALTSPVLRSPTQALVNVGLSVQVDDCGGTKDYSGVPPDGRLTSVQGLGTYQLGPFAGLNAVMIDRFTPPVTIPLPPGSYQKLGFVVSASDAIGPEYAARLNATITYTDGTSDTFPEGLIAPDWFIRYWASQGDPDPKVPDILNAMDLAELNRPWASWNTERFELISMSEAVLRPNPEKTVTSVTLGGGYFVQDLTKAGIFALNGKVAGSGEIVTVDLASTFNRDAIFAGADVHSDLAGFFNPNANLYSEWSGASFLVSGRYPSVVMDMKVYGDEDDTELVGGVFRSPDASDFGNGTLRLRAERKPQSDGRVYLIAYRIRDTVENAAPTQCTTVTVPLRASEAALAAANYQAQRAVNIFTTTGEPPSEYFVIGDGPIIGPKQ